MPVDYKIIPQQGVVFVRYSGFARMEETGRALGQYLQDPSYVPGQKQLVDLSEVTEVEHNFPQLMEMQARKLDIFLSDKGQTLIAYHAPNDISLGMSEMILKSWDGISGIVARVFRTEEDCLQFLGVDAVTFTALVDAD
ncbi:hypothetical protein [Pseudoprimorskyibacter insulae]|uniref:Uncharacterized protein n=1 Tax=Pseudoprimorskyibacter insulae TaxID=1695997 RepID=A0A2R8AXT0_9RHOB|nr:hypothetical protein [Pseudoprimorskyibacter insulae]SPF80767.1 hypothetical protein PRI8871_02579 [Pseudoprimorskyibacter insulae]